MPPNAQPASQRRAAHSGVPTLGDTIDKNKMDSSDGENSEKPRQK